MKKFGKITGEIVCTMFEIDQASVMRENDTQLIVVLDKETIDKMYKKYRFKIRYKGRIKDVYVGDIQGDKIRLKEW